MYCPEAPLVLPPLYPRQSEGLKPNQGGAMCRLGWEEEVETLAQPSKLIAVTSSRCSPRGSFVGFDRVSCAGSAVVRSDDYKLGDAASEALVNNVLLIAASDAHNVVVKDRKWPGSASSNSRPRVEIDDIGDYHIANQPTGYLLVCAAKDFPI